MLKTLKKVPFKEVRYLKSGPVRSVPYSIDNLKILLERVGAEIFIDELDGLYQINFPHLSEQEQFDLGYIGDNSINTKVTDIIDYAVLHKMSWNQIPQGLKQIAKENLRCQFQGLGIKQ